MDYTIYTYREAVGRLKLMLADSYHHAAPQTGTTLTKKISSTNEVNYKRSDILSKCFSSEHYSTPKKSGSTSTLSTTNTVINVSLGTASLLKLKEKGQTIKKSVNMLSQFSEPMENFHHIEKRKDYVDRLEKQSQHCSNELSALLGKVRDVINENDLLTDTTITELKSLSEMSSCKRFFLSKYSNKETYLSPNRELKMPCRTAVPNVVYEACFSELEPNLGQYRIDFKKLKIASEVDKKNCRFEPPSLVHLTPNTVHNCDLHRKQIELLKKEKSSLEDIIRRLQKPLPKSMIYNAVPNLYIGDFVQISHSRAESEVMHLRDELERQHKKIRELQHQMVRRLLDKRVNIENHYNSQMDNFVADFTNQWNQVTKVQLQSELQRRYESDLKNMAQLSVEKHFLEQDVTNLRLHLERASKDHKTETANLNAEIKSLIQRLNQSEADLLQSNRKILRLQDEISKLEKDIVYGELKNEISTTKKHLDKRISEIQERRDSVEYKASLFEKNDESQRFIDDRTIPFNYKTASEKISTEDVEQEDVQLTNMKYETAFDFESKLNKNNNDENLRDHCSEGEKNEQQQQTSSTNLSPTNANDDTNENIGFESQESNLTEYNPDYDVFENYNNQQYDTTSYDTVYEQELYVGEGDQHGDTKQGYESAPNSTAHEYSKSDYDVASFIYDTKGDEREAEEVATSTKETSEGCAIVEESMGDITTVFTETSETHSKPEGIQKQSTTNMSAMTEPNTLVNTEITDLTQSRPDDIVTTTDATDISRITLVHNSPASP